MGGTQGNPTGDPSGGTRSGARLTLREAASVLGISVEAVRKRTARGSLRSDIGADGRRYVYLDDGGDGGPRGVNPEAEDPSLIAAKDETIRLLREELERAAERDRENRRIIAALTSRIPALEAPQEPADEPETVEEEPEKRTPRSDAPGPQEAVRRPWWRRVFGASRS